jgi:hypothetical protein
MSLLSTLAVAVSLLTPSTNVRVGNPFVARLVRDAALAASRKLATAECRQVISDFEGYAGGTLQATLQERQATPESYMQQIVFYDGSRNERCDAEGVLAFTAPGNFVVFVCSAALKAQARRGNHRLTRRPSSTRCCTPWRSGRIPLRPGRSRAGCWRAAGSCPEGTDSSTPLARRRLRPPSIEQLPHSLREVVRSEGFLEEGPSRLQHAVRPQSVVRVFPRCRGSAYSALMGASSAQPPAGNGSCFAPRSASAPLQGSHEGAATGDGRVVWAHEALP